MTLTFTFSHDINESLMEGDDVYYCHHQFHGGLSTVDHENFINTGIVHIGKCIRVNRPANFIIVDIAEPDPVKQQLLINDINIGDFLMFSKDNKANLSSILGYYAETTFINDSPKKAELFAVSTEFSESSK
tara:strand:+ start:1328 stop:1720 length:393 start_codon:yes stop_codon:yes gene_type:complete